jgi:osmotically-inducible protein OsmY
MILRITNQMEQTASPPYPISAIAEFRLRASSHTALRRISCKSDQGVLVLEGHVHRFFHKQLAQEIAFNIEGVVQVINQIEVVSTDRSRLSEN